jgi:hypothetical protein
MRTLGSNISNVAKQISTSVLRPCASELRAKSNKNRRRNLFADSVHRETVDEFKTNPANESFAHRGQLWLQPRHGKVVPGDFRDVAA